jgi:hypothetical protein
MGGNLVAGEIAFAERPHRGERRGRRLATMLDEVG